ncbi:MAG: hypothetical protein ACE5PM_09470 [Candidatus Hydrothermarchaeales archaeon]
MKYIFDSDALIKITKSGAAKKILQKIDGMITKEVLHETIKGEEEFEDAVLIKKFVDEKILKVVKAKKNKKAGEILEGVYGLGEGEVSVLHAFFSERLNFIVSDDLAFLRIVDMNGLPFLVPGNLIARGVELGWLTPKEGERALSNIEYLINKEEYRASMNAIKKLRR